jgi:hypothetical protein
MNLESKRAYSLFEKLDPYCMVLLLPIYSLRGTSQYIAFLLYSRFVFTPQ